MQTILLQLMNVMLRLFHTGSREDALPLLVHLQHVEFRFLLCPPKYLLEHMRDVVHVIHRIIPADHQITRLQLRPGLAFHLYLRTRQDFGCYRFGHKRNLKEGQALVEEELSKYCLLRRPFNLLPQS